MNLRERLMADLNDAMRQGDAVRRAVDEMGAHSLAQMAPVMRRIMAEPKGQANGRMPAEIVRELLT